MRVRQPAPGLGRLVHELGASCRRIWRDERGTSAVELGLISVPFFSLLLVMFEVSLLFLIGQTLDTSLDEAARQLLTGQAQTATGASAVTDIPTFKANILCPKLPAIINCSQVQVNVSVISSFASAGLGTPISNGSLNTSSWGYQACSGSSSTQIMKVEAIYPVSALSSFWAPYATITINGTLDRVLYASTVFRCEPFASS